MNTKHFLFCFSLSLLISCGSDHLLKEVKVLHHYPSASGIEYANGKGYLIGDDASYLLILDNKLSPADSIPLYGFSQKRTPKAIKPDLESATITRDNKLLLLGSGSLSPYRNIAWLINPYTKQKDSIRLDTFYQRLHQYGISEVNIEGACSLYRYTILANRGSKGYPKNQLIFTAPEFWKDQSHSPVSTAFIGVNTDSTQFSGVSGLTYSSSSDRLIVTVSTEDTRNSLDDGAIGKSYLWIIKNFVTKTKWKAINPDQVIDLSEIDSRFNGQKIESVCITSENSEFLYLTLAADNDNGSSTLFSITVRKD